MEEYLSPSARRAVEAAAEWAVRLGSATVEPLHVLLAVAAQEESRGATLLAKHGFQCAMHEPAIVAALCETAESIASPATSPPVRHAIGSTRRRSVERGPDNPAGTDLLLLELIVAAPELHDWLAERGVAASALVSDLEAEASTDVSPLAAEFDGLEVQDTTEHVDRYRILDASANRAREGLRVIEDFFRFACDDPLLSAELKSIRHQLRAALDQLPAADLLASRETERDVGKRLSTAAEFARGSTLDVFAANFKRTQEALRSLEEFGKLESRPMAEQLEAIRYRLYTLERAALIGADSRVRLSGVVLYVLVSSASCSGGLEWTVREALAGGAQVIQLREKTLSDRDLVALARRLRAWTRDAGALFIMNDRPDIARLVGADGVHVGQDDLSVKDARRVIGPRGLVGVSSHSIEQARAAVLDGANTIGVGPTFPSATKPFEQFPGLEFVRQATAEIRLPAFVIGGVDLDHLDDAIAAGARRVAVSAAICVSDDPRAAAAELRARLDAAREA